MREESGGVWIPPWVQGVFQDARYALKVLRRQPLFGLGAVFVLALGIGLVTAVFTFANATFLRPWRVPDARSMVLIRPRLGPSGFVEFAGISIAEYRYLRAHTQTLTHIIGSARSSAQVRYRPGAELEQVNASYVSGNYFDALGVGMAAGRGFLPDEDDYRVPQAVVILSERLWRERFGRDPSLIGRTVQIGRQSFMVVGVTPRGFVDPQGSRYEVWWPWTTRALGSAADLAAFDDPRRSNWGFFCAGRLGPGVSYAQAEAELTTLRQQFRSAASLPAVGVRILDTRPISDGGMRGPRQVVTLLVVALLLVQLLACANVGNLLLARALARQRELAIRLSLGASRARVVRQLMTEAGLLSVSAGALGFGLASAVPPIVLRFVEDWPERQEFYSADALVFGFSLAMTVLTTLACGLAPALRGTRLSLASAMAERHGQSSGGTRLRRLLLATQIALATVLLVGAGLLTRAIGHAFAIEPGFALHETQAITATLPPGSQSARRTAFYRGLRDALRTADVPPVAFSDLPPFKDTRYVIPVRHPNELTGPIHLIVARPVSPNYFDVLGIAIIAGRVPRDETDQRELVVSQAAARELWPNENPIGRKLLSGMESAKLAAHEVVGVAADVPVRTLTEVEPVIYHASDYFRPTLLVRSLSLTVIDRIRSAAAAVDPEVLLVSRPLSDNVRESLSIAIIGSRVAWAIAGLGLFLATVGAFGVFAYAVEERRREIGIRMALGARRAEIVRLALQTAQRSVFSGLAAGFVLAAVAFRLLRSYLYGLSPFDLIAYAQIGAILLAAAAVATWIPARRATRVDPAVTLRCD